MYGLVRPFLFRMDAETAHKFAFRSLKCVWSTPLLREMFTWKFQHPSLTRNVFGLDFPNPVGLAAGFDKDALLGEHWRRAGFGFVELGTVTPRPQSGNPRPRLFRIVQDNAIINRMGFNNEGLQAMVARLRNRNHRLIIGGNIGKNKDTPNETAVSDYLACFDALHPLVDYFTVNVSSPNTPGLRALQEKEPLTHILSRLQERNADLPRPKPILLKIAPDLTDEQLNDVVDIAHTVRLAGLVATNTTISRSGLTLPKPAVAEIGAGGLSGAPLTQRSTDVIRYLHQKSGGTLPIIGVGGIMTPEDALEKMKAGASLIQLYSGFVYHGPPLVREICRKLTNIRT